MATAQRRETVRRVQVALASGYSALGAWCLIHPSSVIALGFTSAYAVQSATTATLMRCFGAQAMTVALVLGTAQMTSFSFKLFAAAMVPYVFGFNFWFGIGPGRGMFTKMMWLDFIGNVTFGLGSWWCSRLLAEVEKEEKLSRKRGD